MSNISLEFLEIQKLNNEQSIELSLKELCDKAKELSQQRKGFELSGTYNYISSKYTINLNATMYDHISDRPYSFLPDDSETKIVFHTHPFNTYNPMDFPSLEDLFTVGKNPKQVYLLITDTYIYIFSANEFVDQKYMKKLFDEIEKYPDINSVLPLNKIHHEYDYSRIEKNWEQKAYLHVNKLPLFITQIKLSDLLENIFLLDEQIFIAFSKKEEFDEFNLIVNECYQSKYKKFISLKDRLKSVFQKK